VRVYPLKTHFSLMSWLWLYWRPFLCALNESKLLILDAGHTPIAFMAIRQALSQTFIHCLFKTFIADWAYFEILRKLFRSIALLLHLLCNWWKKKTDFVHWKSLRIYVDTKIGQILPILQWVLLYLMSPLQLSEWIDI